jgi:hypothetical protein
MDVDIEPIWPELNQTALVIEASIDSEIPIVLGMVLTGKLLNERRN